MDSKKKKHPIFNQEWEILSSLGEGNTSKVYKVRNIKTGGFAALKLLREEFLQRDKSSIKSVEQEIQILEGLKHNNIVGILGFGSDGHVKKNSGREISGLVYIMLEFVSGGLLFDVCQSLGSMGETVGRFFLTQMLDVLEYMHGKGVVHRDLKLENILVDDKMNLKVADFGFATFRKVHSLKSYRGTMTYMAPEIKEGKVYDGMQIDLFSTAVILFIIVQGIFPFKEAKKDEYFYSLILSGNLDTYWKKTGATGLSDEFKDLILKMFSYDGKKRPTIKQIREHPWMAGEKVNMDKLRMDIIGQVTEARTASTVSTTREETNCRGDDYVSMIREVDSLKDLQLVGFNDRNEFDIDVAPGVIYEDLCAWNTEVYKEAMQIDIVEKEGAPRNILLTINDPNNVASVETEEGVQTAEADKIVVKVKFFSALDDEDGKVRVRFHRKRGNMIEWTRIFDEIKKTHLGDVLLLPREHLQNEDEK